MNIFVLHQNPRIAATMLCNQHVTKMVLESTQMLCTVLRKQGVEDDVLREHGVVTKSGTTYSLTHGSHPCLKWAMSSRNAFDWLLSHALGLATEYALRFGKRHACVAPILGCALIVERDLLPRPLTYGPMLPFAQAMPDEHKISGDAVRAYRSYYHQKCADWSTEERLPRWPSKPLDRNRGGVDENQQTARAPLPNYEGFWRNVPAWLKAGQVRKIDDRTVVARVWQGTARSVRKSKEHRCLVTGYNAQPDELAELFG